VAEDMAAVTAPGVVAPVVEPVVDPVVAAGTAVDIAASADDATVVAPSATSGAGDTGAEAVPVEVPSAGLVAVVSVPSAGTALSSALEPAAA
jgi:hypothetical protein